MLVQFHEAEGIFHLQSKAMSYIIQLVNGTLSHVYWGKKLNENGNLIGLLNTRRIRDLTGYRRSIRNTAQAISGVRPIRFNWPMEAE